MKTDILAPTPEAIKTASKLLENHEVVAFPTETVYGLGARIFDSQAIEKIFTVKGRPSDNPLIAHIADAKQAVTIGKDIPEEFYLLAKSFFPGPLTLVVNKQESVPDIATAGLPTIGIRLPNHPAARSLIAEVGYPLVAPSANLSGRPSPTTALHVYDDLAGKIPLILDGGPCIVGLESTVLDLTQKPFTILRPGKITAHELEQILRLKVEIVSKEDSHNAPKAPGMKYTHYQPLAKVTLTHQVEAIIASSSTMILVDPKQIDAVKKSFENTLIEPLTTETLYAAMRKADKLNLKNIIVLVDKSILDQTDLMDRLNKASST